MIKARVHSSIQDARLLAISVTLVLGFVALLALLAGDKPWVVISEVFVSPFSSPRYLLENLARSTPIILTGLSALVAFKAGFWNIGAEGQLYAGALAASWVGVKFTQLPPVLLISLALLTGFLAGALCCLIPALLKILFKSDEFITTFLMNYVMAFGISWLLTGAWKSETSMWPQSPDIAPGAYYPIIPQSRVHLGLLIGMGATVLIYVLVQRTVFGYRLRMVGQSPTIALAAGIPIKRIVLMTALISGGLAGLAGVGEVLGIHHHLTETISNNFGYTGIVIATLSNLNPIGAMLTALYLGTLENGAKIASMHTNIPSHLAGILQGVMLIISITALASRRQNKKEDHDGY